MENKYLKGNLDKNIAFGLSWLVWPFAVVLFILDKNTLTRDEKKTLLTIFVCAVFNCIPVVCVVSMIFVIIAAIKAFMKQDYEVPVASKIADKLADKFLK